MSPPAFAALSCSPGDRGRPAGFFPKVPKGGRPVRRQTPQAIRGRNARPSRSFSDYLVRGEGDVLNQVV